MPLSATIDRWIENYIALEVSPFQARELMARSVVVNSIIGLGPRATEEDFQARLRNLPRAKYDVAVHAELFALDALAGLDGRAILQAGVLALRCAETIALGTEGRFASSKGRPRELDLIRKVGRELTGLFRAETNRNLAGHAAALLAATCSSQHLRGWRVNALRKARENLPALFREKRDLQPDQLPPGPHQVYLSTLHRTFSRELRR